MGRDQHAQMPCGRGEGIQGRTLPKPPEPISQSLPSECLAMTMSSGLISQELEGTTSGRLDAPLYCLRRHLQLNSVSASTAHLRFSRACTPALGCLTNSDGEITEIHLLKSPACKSAQKRESIGAAKQGAEQPAQARPARGSQRVLQLVHYCSSTSGTVMRRSSCRSTVHPKP